MRFAVIAVALVMSGTCSPQCGKPNTSPGTTPSAVAKSPSPIPTAPLQAASPPFHNGEVGIAYGAVALSATGGRSPYTWSVFSGALPSGVTLGNDGSVSGSPTTPGNFSFTIQVKDAGDSSASIPGTMSIAPALTAGLIASCAQYCNVELGCDSTCGAFGQQNGGAGPFTYSLTGGQLPAGTALNELSLKGTFGGSSGWLQFTVQVGDALGATAPISPKFWMYDHIAWSGTYHCNGTYNTPCQVQVPYSGGVPGGQPQVTLASVGPYCPPNFPVCPPPPTNTPGGIATMATAVGPNGGGTMTFTVAAHCGSGTGSCPSGYYGAIGLVLVDQAVCGANMRCQTGIATVDVYMQTG